ncbi:DUF4365 domain-containing protein [Polyangium sp. 15x6]|uniref:DUF4365 domain-containing protein n=1 Tax=Polyangium sp. 15x6 TaxID=3042687 RepID=UPI00249BBBEF|nr:DUF4365 domain-containing protein [Polyangium sp. 15x6]MDI3286101.1 DUF4365 domain-containing protein [Polyangium sp. 15x6]
MTTVRNSDFVGRRGVLKLLDICAEANQICREFTTHDVGVDAQIELVDGIHALAQYVNVQVKTGTSHVNESDEFWFVADRKHMFYWNGSMIPVIAVIYDPLTNRAVWIDVTGGMGDRISRQDFRWSVKFGPESVLTPGTLLSKVIPTVKDHIDNAFSRPSEGATSHVVWFMLIGILVCPESPTPLVADAAYRLALYLGQVDNAQAAAVVATVSSLSNEQLLRVVAAADYLFERGESFAQHVANLLDKSKSTIRQLEKLIKMGAVPPQHLDVAIQIVESSQNEFREDLWALAQKHNGPVLP